jgi:hypothetical protein
MQIVCTNCRVPKDKSEFPKHDKAYPRTDHPHFGISAWCKAYHNLKDKRKRVGTPQWRLASIKRCAKGRHIPWELTREQAMKFWQTPCAYCGAEIETLGLDRVDYTKPYTIDNVVSCCRLCNVMKFTLSPEEFLAHCRRIVEHAKTLRSREVA